MKKNIIITAGPTNERIDAVMKITNMSTGALGAVLADTLLAKNEDEIDTICDYFIKDYYDMLEGKIEVEYELSSGK